VFDKGQDLFSFWTRALIAICLLPVAQAMAFVFTTQLAEAFHSKDQGFGVGAIVGLIILLAGMKILVKANHMARGYVTGNQSGGKAILARAGAAAAKVGGVAGTAVTGNPTFAKAGQVAGNALESRARSSEASNARWAGSGARAPVPVAGSRTNPFARGSGGERGQAASNWPAASPTWSPRTARSRRTRRSACAPRTAP
jgi:hypothetical protein